MSSRRIMKALALVTAACALMGTGAIASAQQPDAAKQGTTQSAQGGQQAKDQGSAKQKQTPNDGQTAANTAQQQDDAANQAPANVNGQTDQGDQTGQNGVAPQDDPPANPVPCTPKDDTNDWGFNWSLDASCTLHITGLGRFARTLGIGKDWAGENGNFNVNDTVVKISVDTMEASHLPEGEVIVGSQLFANMPNLTSIEGLNKLDFSHTGAMDYMFYNDPKLKSVDLTGVDTHKVTDMHSMFAGPETKKIDENGHQTEKTDYALSSVTFGPDFDTSSVTDMSWMFENCENLTTLDLSMFDTHNVTTMKSMFDTDNVDNGTDNPAMHYYAFKGKLRSIKFGQKFDTSKVTDMSQMFSSDNQLESLDVSHFNTGNVTTMASMFSNLAKPTVIDVSGFDTSKCTNMAFMFNGDLNVLKLDVGGFDMSHVTTTECMFQSCQSVTSLAVSEFDTANDTSMQYMFFGCKALTTLNVSGFNTAKCTSMKRMFAGDENLIALDVSHFNTSLVHNMEGMFVNCLQVTNLNVSGFDTGNAIEMASMFAYDWHVAELDVSHFNTSKVGTVADKDKTCNSTWDGSYNTDGSPAYQYTCNTTMEEMFTNCYKVTHINAGAFDTSNVTGMKDMFSRDDSMESLNLGSFDTSKVTDMDNMFSQINIGLKVIVLSQDMRVPAGTTHKNMFLGLDYVPDWVQVDPPGIATESWPWGQMVGGAGLAPDFPTSGNAQRTGPTTYVHDGWVALKFEPNNPANGGNSSSMAGVTGTMDVYAAKPGATLDEMPVNHYTIAGRRFVHWNTKDNDSGSTYKVGDSYTVPSSTDKNTTISFYAHWFTLPAQPLVTKVEQVGHAVNGSIPTDGSAKVNVTVKYTAPEATNTAATLKIYAKPGRNSFLTEADVLKFPIISKTGADIPSGTAGDEVTNTFSVKASDIKFLDNYPDFNWTFTVIENLTGVDGEQSDWKAYYGAGSHLDFAPPVIKADAECYRVTGKSTDAMTGLLADNKTGLTAPTASDGWDTSVSGEPAAPAFPHHEKAGNSMTFMWPDEPGSEPATASSDPLNGKWSVHVDDITQLTEPVGIVSTDSLGNQSYPTTVQLVFTPVIDKVTSPTTVKGELPAGSMVKVKLSHLAPVGDSWTKLDLGFRPLRNSLPDNRSDLTNMGTTFISFSRGLCSASTDVGCADTTVAETGDEATAVVDVPVDASHPFTQYPSLEWTIEARAEVGAQSSGVAKMHQLLDMEPPSIAPTKNTFNTNEKVTGQLWNSTRTDNEAPAWTVDHDSAPVNPARGPELAAKLKVTWPDGTTANSDDDPGVVSVDGNGGFSLTVPDGMKAGTAELYATDTKGNESYRGSVELKLPYVMLGKLPFTGSDSARTRLVLGAITLAILVTGAVVSRRRLRRRL
ncbi:BspA family leucine-rich repeat surface protein [Bifidobacterium sp. ESL0763]|uniref:BspA family leucine-rich repeat surface protein n=1 Tax=Bifidobacterium sp. ESL0763 TaxID=2983227 RepID=UPI0023FA2A34|nr:BspA family leucine-rich repeat surface protein [Bifidobacterium sp. ESL0763]MDF7663882.1 BspA family leucine-rich repeat surface protein [Bifidobacterium sp. ESL0763]